MIKEISRLLIIGIIMVGVIVVIGKLGQDYKEYKEIKSTITNTRIDIVKLEIENNALKRIINEKDSLIKEKDSLLEEQEALLQARRTPTNTSTRGNTLKPLTNEFEATGYCSCSKCNGKWTGLPTASGTKMIEGRTIAVDPNVIPLGTVVYIEGMGEYIAEDTGSAIKGNKIDIFFNSHQKALEFGRRKVQVGY